MKNLTNSPVKISASCQPFDSNHPWRQIRHLQSSSSSHPFFNNLSLNCTAMILTCCLMLVMFTASCVTATNSPSSTTSLSSATMPMVDQETSGSELRPLAAEGLIHRSRQSSKSAGGNSNAQQAGFFGKLASKVQQHFVNGALPKRNRRNLMGNHQNRQHALKPSPASTVVPTVVASKRSAQVGSLLDWLPGRNNHKDDATDKDLEDFEDMLKAFVQYAPAEDSGSSSGQGEAGKLTEALTDYISDIKSSPDNAEDGSNNHNNGFRHRPSSRPAHGYQGERFQSHSKPRLRNQPPINLVNLSPSPALQSVLRQEPSTILPINNGYRPRPIPHRPIQTFPTSRNAPVLSNVDPIPRQLNLIPMASNLYESRQRPPPHRRLRQQRRHPSQSEHHQPVAQDRNWSQPLAAPVEQPQPDVTSYGLYLDKPPRFYSIVDSTPLADSSSEYGTWVPVIPDSYFLETEARSEFILSRKDHIAKVKYPGALRPFLTPPPEPTQQAPLAVFKQKKQITYGNNKHSNVHHLPGVEEALAPYEDPALYQTTAYQQEQAFVQPQPDGDHNSVLNMEHRVAAEDGTAPALVPAVEDEHLRRQILRNTLAQRRNSLSPHQLPNAVHFKADPLFESNPSISKNAWTAPHQPTHQPRNDLPAAYVPEDDTLFRGKVTQKMANNAHYNRHKYRKNHRFDPPTAAARAVPRWQENDVVDRNYNNPNQQRELPATRPLKTHQHAKTPLPTLAPIKYQVYVHSPVHLGPISPTNAPAAKAKNQQFEPKNYNKATTTFRTTTQQATTTTTPAPRKTHGMKAFQRAAGDKNEDYADHSAPKTRQFHNDNNNQDRIISTTTHSQSSDWTDAPAFGFSPTAINKNWQETANEVPVLPPVTGVWRGIDVDEPNDQPTAGNDFSNYYPSSHNKERTHKKPVDVMQPHHEQPERQKRPTRPVVRAKATTTVAPTGVAPSPTPLPDYTDSSQEQFPEEASVEEYTPVAIKKTGKKKDSSRTRLHYTESRQGNNAHGQQQWPLPPSAASNPVKTYTNNKAHKQGKDDDSHGKTRTQKPSVLQIRGKYATTRRQERKMNFDSSSPSQTGSSPGQQAPVSSGLDYYDDYPLDTNSNQQFSQQTTQKHHPAEQAHHVSPAAPATDSANTEEEEGDDEGDYNDYGTSEAIQQLDSLLADPSTAPAASKHSPTKKAKAIHTNGAANYPFMQVYKPSSAAGYLASRGSIPVSTFENFKVSEDNDKRSPVTSPGAELPESELADYPDDSKQQYEDDEAAEEDEDKNDRRKTSSSSVADGKDDQEDTRTHKQYYDVRGEVSSGDPDNDASKEAISAEDDDPDSMTNGSDEDLEDDESRKRDRTKSLGNMLRKFLTRS